MASIDEEIQRVFGLQRANRTRLKRTSPEERREKLLRFRAAVVEHADEASAALHADLGKPLMGIEHFEIQSVLSTIDEAVAALDEWMQPLPVEPSAQFTGNEAYILYEPRGVVLLFGPWNFPLALSLEPLVPIIAAGNSAIVKPNELQPQTSKVIARIIQQAFSEDEVAVFEGGIPVAEALQDLPFDHVFFTGSPAIGKRVMAAAARHLTSVTLELGGKCPAIIDDHYPIADAAQKIVGSRFFNAGQLCLAVDYVLVPRDRERELVDTVKAMIDAFFYVDGVFQAERMSRLVDGRNFDRVAGYIEDAVQRGARIEKSGGQDRAALRMEPVVLTGVNRSARIMQEEIFGPVLPVIGYDDADEIEAIVDATGKPLALYAFSNNEAFVDDILTRTSSGGVTVNGVMTHYAESRLPFGGVNGSGMGRYRGRAGFLELSNARSVFRHRDAA
jgi:aldehyde dehydrogenase (NAD+)